MTSVQHRIFIDECLPPELGDVYLKPHIQSGELPLEVVHYYERYGPKGKWKDSKFIPDLGRDRRWIVITRDKADRQIDSMRLLCRREAVTLLYLTPAVIKRGLTFYGPPVLANVSRITDVNLESRGAQAAIRVHNSFPSAYLQLVECPGGYVLEHGSCVKAEKSGRQKR